MVQCDFKHIRDNVDIIRAAEWLGLRLGKKLFSEQLRCECPISGGGPRALVITPSISRWYCFAPECRRGGDVIELATKILKIPPRDAALKLQSQFLNGTYRQDFTQQEKLAKVEEKLAYEHDCVQALGFTPEQARALGIGYMAGGTMPKRLLVPIRNREGDTLGFIGLSPDADIKRPKAWHNE